VTDLDRIVMLSLALGIVLIVVALLLTSCQVPMR
jgi:hypothetical protein